MVEVLVERPELTELLAAARARGPLTADEIQAQRESWVRSCSPELRGRPRPSQWRRMVRWVIQFLIKRYGV